MREMKVYYLVVWRLKAAAHRLEPMDVIVLFLVKA